MKHCLILLASVFLLTSCGKPTAPTGQQVTDYFNSHLPSAAPIEFTAPTLETFPEPDGRCRVKYKVTVKLKEDMLSAVSASDAMKAAGWNTSIYTEALAQLTNIDEPFKSSVTSSQPATELIDLKLAKIASKAGTETQVFGTLEAERQADDSWTFTAIEGGSMTEKIPGQFSASHAPAHFLSIDSDEAKKVINDEVDREKAFIAAVAAAKQQSDAARATQLKEKADQHAVFVKQVLEMTSAGKAYMGTLISNKGATQIKLVFDFQSDGGKGISAHFENPADPSQIHNLSGSLILDKDEYPVHLRGGGTHIQKPLPDPLLTQWLGELSYPIKLKPTATGELIGEGYGTRMEFKALISPDQAPVTSTDPNP